jgi:hypothetical protein
LRVAVAAVPFFFCFFWSFRSLHFNHHSCA